MPAQTVIQIRRDTAANWTSVNPTLASGEIGFETDTNQLKVGDNSTAWTSLPYASGAGGASVEISETAPAEPEAGDVWFNSTDGRAYIYYDSTWVDLNPGIAGPAGKFTVSETAPSDPSAGDGWFNSATAKLFIYYDAFWVEATSNYMGPSGEDGLVISTDAPSVTDVLWLDTDEEADAPVPAGGATGQILAKSSTTDYDTEWVNPPSGNAIINGAFEINQRGFTSSTANGYTFDRWTVLSASGTCTTSAQTFTAGAAPEAGYEATNFVRLVSSGQSGTDAFYFLTQKIEDVRSFANQTVTVSFWAKAGSGTPSIAIELDQQFDNGSRLTTALGKKEITTNFVRYTASVLVPTISGQIPGPASSLNLNFFVSAGSDFNARTDSLGIQSNTFDIWGVQVEAGSTATPFRRNANSLQGELAACHRYYQEHDKANGYFVSGSVVNTTDVVFAYPLITSMRVTPSLAISATGDFQMIGASAASVSSIIGVGSSNGISSFYAVSSGLTAGQSRTLFGSNANARIKLSAEL